MSINVEFPLLSELEQSTLQEALYYMKMVELRKACDLLRLSNKGTKKFLIERILAFICDGSIITMPQMPDVSKAKNHPAQPLRPSSLMLHGEYKNDLKTRDFFKKLIGSYFHFTAFGIDWLNERWLSGNPPTYQEFADFWTKEMALRKKEKPAPKDEWMFIRFVQKVKKEEPQVSKKDLLFLWKQEQTQKKDAGFQLIKKAREALD